ncbi:hypothetical protein MIND_00184600 [Mycena indigotica]|uniref:Uncharacterized protein n=1 Tax=Mycena indigotica TaxID=2126181 RepID=A0A8H6WAM7_9AGAR|nr:uncharacterized protein MIND_00184600 [Mycena indigotica]KAF7311744.1 hypothetical protein MIND_00184600 [Mycena indigotica]
MALHQLYTRSSCRLLGSTPGLHIRIDTGQQPSLGFHPDRLPSTNATRSPRLYPAARASPAADLPRPIHIIIQVEVDELHGSSSSPSGLRRLRRHSLTHRPLRHLGHQRRTAIAVALDLGERTTSSVFFHFPE